MLQGRGLSSATCGAVRQRGGFPRPGSGWSLAVSLEAEGGNLGGPEPGTAVQDASLQGTRQEAQERSTVAVAGWSPRRPISDGSLPDCGLRKEEGVPSPHNN